MDTWPHTISSWSMKKILECVDNEQWQRFRLSLKGLSTQEKLDKLERYYQDRYIMANTERQADTEKCRIDNYINALKRGGQLSIDLKVLR